MPRSRNHYNRLHSDSLKEEKHSFQPLLDKDEVDFDEDLIPHDVNEAMAKEEIDYNTPIQEAVYQDAENYVYYRRRYFLTKPIKITTPTGEVKEMRHRVFIIEPGEAIPETKMGLLPFISPNINDFEKKGEKIGGMNNAGADGGNYLFRYICPTVRDENGHAKIQQQMLLFKQDTGFTGTLKNVVNKLIKLKNPEVVQSKVIAEFVASRIMNCLIGDTSSSIFYAVKPPHSIPDLTGNNVYIGSIFFDNYEDFFIDVARVQGLPVPGIDANASTSRFRHAGTINKYYFLHGLLQTNERNEIEYYNEKKELVYTTIPAGGIKLNALSSVISSLIYKDKNGNTITKEAAIKLNGKPICRFHDLPRICMASVLVNDFDIHSGNFGPTANRVLGTTAQGAIDKKAFLRDPKTGEIVKDAFGKIGSLRRIDQGGALHGLRDFIRMHSHSEHPMFVGPTNHYRELPRSLRISKEMAEEADRIANFDKVKLDKSIHDAMFETAIFYGAAPMAAFIKRILNDNSGTQAIKECLQDMSIDDFLNKLKGALTSDEEKNYKHFLGNTLFIKCRTENLTEKEKAAVKKQYINASLKMLSSKKPRPPQPPSLTVEKPSTEEQIKKQKKLMKKYNQQMKIYKKALDEYDALQIPNEENLQVKNLLTKKITGILIEKMHSRQESLRKYAFDIKLSLCVKQDSDGKYQLDNTYYKIDDLIKQYPEYVSDAKRHFRALGHIYFNLFTVNITSKGVQLTATKNLESGILNTIERTQGSSIAKKSLKGYAVTFYQRTSETEAAKRRSIIPEGVYHVVASKAGFARQFRNFYNEHIRRSPTIASEEPAKATHLKPTDYAINFVDSTTSAGKSGYYIEHVTENNKYQITAQRLPPEINKTAVFTKVLIDHCDNAIFRADPQHKDRLTKIARRLVVNNNKISLTKLKPDDKVFLQSLKINDIKTLEKTLLDTLHVARTQQTLNNQTIPSLAYLEYAKKQCESLLLSQGENATIILKPQANEEPLLMQALILVCEVYNTTYKTRYKNQSNYGKNPANQAQINLLKDPQAIAFVKEQLKIPDKSPFKDKVSLAPDQHVNALVKARQM